MSNLIHFSDTDLSDFSKDANGFRNRSYKEWWTQEELDAEYAHLSMICEDNFLHETKREAEALVKFDILIKRTINNGAADRQTAIRWLVQAEGLEFHEYDLEHFFWNYGLSYQLQKELAKEFSEKLKKVLTC